MDEIGIEISTSKSTIVQQHTKSTVSPLAIVATGGVTLQHQISAPAQLTSEQSSMSKAASTSNSNKNGSFLFLKDREDFRTNSHIKPPYSYSQLIILSMKESNYAKMTLQMIYDWIIENFSYFKKADPNWQVTFKNSIRHNLSLNKCFRKIARQKDEPGKGGFWTLDPDFEKQLNESNFLNSNSSSSCASPSSASANKIANVLGTQQPTDLKALKRRRKSSTSDGQTAKTTGGSSSSSSAKTIRTLQSESKKFKSAGNDSTGNNSSFSSSSTSSSSSSSSFISSSTESNLTSSPNGNNNNWQTVVTKSQPPSSSSLQSQSNYFSASTPGYGHNGNVNTRNPTISSSFAHHSTASNHQHHPLHNHQFNGDYINGPSGIINPSGSHNHHHHHNHQYLDHSLL